MSHSTSLLPLLARAGRAAVQWRLLVLWMLCLLAPAALMALPVWRVLGLSFDHSVHAASLAQQLDLSAIADAMANFNRSGAVAMEFAAVEALGLTLLLSPLLSGMVMSAARAVQPQGFGALIAGGLEEYPRMARMLLLALIPLGLAAAIGGGAMAAASKYSHAAILESDADSARLLAMLVFSLAIVLAHATLDAGRAALALDRRRRSALRAWMDGCKLLVRRPFGMLGIYLAITLAGLAVAAALSVARIDVAAVSAAGVAGAFLLTELIVAVLAWMRITRLFAMVDLARKPAPRIAAVRAAVSTN